MAMAGMIVADIRRRPRFPGGGGCANWM